MLLEGYADNIQRYGHHDVGIIIIGDKKTPNTLVKKLTEKIKARGLSVEYLDIRNQRKWLTSFPDLRKIIPYNSDNRRNIGYLIAAEKGARIIVSIDDDNYCGSEDVVKQHGIVGTEQRFAMVRSTNGWFNPCSMLRIDPPKTIYPRGFPYSKRWKDNVSSITYSSGRIVLNLGLWTGDPDVDAITNLNEHVQVKEIKSEQIMLAPGTYSPINTQNTAFHRDILPCYYYLLMGARISGLRIDRYGDIWSGLFAKKVIDQMNDRLSIGKPIADHRRNPHNLFSDLKSELWGMILNESLVQKLELIELNGKTYADSYLELAHKLQDMDISEDATVKKYFRRLTYAMEKWIDACEKIL